VTREGRLCGHIVAGRDSLPWAYMITTEDIIDDMKYSLEGPTDVHLPSEVEIKAMRDARAEIVPASPHDHLETGSSCTTIIDDMTNFPCENPQFGGGNPTFRGEHQPNDIVHNVDLAINNQKESLDVTPQDFEIYPIEEAKHQKELEAKETGGHDLSKAKSSESDIEYPHSLKLGLIILALCLSVFSLGLVPYPRLISKILTNPNQENTMVATALPRITDEFNSLSDIGWYGSGKSHVPG